MHYENVMRVVVTGGAGQVRACEVAVFGNGAVMI
jgi:hypothetical protein